MRSCWFCARIWEHRSRQPVTVMAKTKTLRAHLLHVRDTQHETYCIEDIGLPGPVKTRDGIERRVPSCDSRSYGIRFESYSRRQCQTRAKTPQAWSQVLRSCVPSNTSSSILITSSKSFRSSQVPRRSEYTGYRRTNRVGSVGCNESRDKCQLATLSSNTTAKFFARYARLLLVGLHGLLVTFVPHII